MVIRNFLLFIGWERLGAAGIPNATFSEEVFVGEREITVRMIFVDCSRKDVVVIDGAEKFETIFTFIQC